jgi:hypothetical protein
MDTITAALILACLGLLAWPTTVRRRGPLFLAVGVVMLIMLWGVVAALFGGMAVRGPDSSRVWLVLNVLIFTVLHVLAFLLLVMAVTGHGLAELFGEIAGGLQSLTGPSSSSTTAYPTAAPGATERPVTARPPATPAETTGPGGSPPPKF